MIKGTTPTHFFTIPFKSSDISKVRVVYGQENNPILVKTNDHCTIQDNLISVTLTQNETFLFDAEKSLEVQVRLLTTNGNALASVPKRIGITNCLENEVIE